MLIAQKHCGSTIGYCNMNETPVSPLPWSGGMLSFTSVQRERDQTSKQDVLKNAISILLKKSKLFL